MRGAAQVLLLLALACSSPAPPPEELPARRQDVAAALYEQLDLVLARHEALEGEPGPEAERERRALARLAGEITFRLARLDPNADVADLLNRLERTR